MPARVCFGSKNSFRPRSGQLESLSPGSAPISIRLRDADVVAIVWLKPARRSVASPSGVVWFHRKRTMASICAERMRRRVVSG